jgi:hypothetical protein
MAKPGRPKKSDTLKQQISALRYSQNWRKHEDRDSLWDRMIDLYRGKHYASKSKEDRMVVNLAFATKNVIAPSVAINNPKFTVNARKPESAATAIITEQVLNYLWRAHKYQVEFRLAVDDSLTIGHGWIKCGYSAKKPKMIEYIDEAVDGTEECEGVDDRDETVPGNVETEVNTFGDEDRPFAERVSPFDIFVDPDARHPREMKWIAQRTRRPLADVVVDKRYNAAQRARVNTKMSEKRIDDETRAIDGEPRDFRTDVTYVDVWEFYDIRKGTVSTFCAESEEGFLIDPQPMPYPFGHPFVMLRNYEVPDQFYPMGDLEQIEQLQYELNATRTQQMNHRKRFQRKYLVEESAMDDEFVNALRDDTDNVAVPVNAEELGLKLGDIVAPMPQMGVAPDLYSMSDVISNDIDRVSGVSDYMRGAQAEIRRTATEAAMIQDAMNARAADKLSQIEGTLAEIGMRLVKLMQTYMTGESVVRIVGMSAAPVWIQFDADYIKGEFDFEVEGGSTQPRNESFRRQSALQLVDALGPFIEMGVVDPTAVARKVLQDGFDVKDPDLFLVPQQVDPMTGQPVPAGTQQPGMPPEEGAPTGPQFPEGVQQTTQEDALAGSPIPGIPPELVAQLAGQQGLPTG